MSSDAISKIIDELIDREGGYVNHPADKGGPTNFGWTQATAEKELNWKEDVKNLPRELAASGYFKVFFVQTGIKAVYELYPELGIFMLDAAVNHGKYRPCRWLQEVLNVFNKQGTLWPNLVVDGVLGDVSLGCLRKMLAYAPKGLPAEAGKIVLLTAIQDRRGSYFQAIGADNESQEVFMWGWYWNRVILLAKELEKCQQ